MDTHIWIWWHNAPEEIPPEIHDCIRESGPGDELLLSAISPWEFCKLIEKEKIEISCDPRTWMREALDMARLRLVPLSPLIAYKSTVLPPPFHNDPADQIIVATAREKGGHGSDSGSTYPKLRARPDHPLASFRPFPTRAVLLLPGAVAMICRRRLPIDATER